MTEREKLFFYGPERKENLKMKQNLHHTVKTVMALFICFVSVLLAIAPAVSYIAGTPDPLTSYATDSEKAAEDAKGTDAAEDTEGAEAADKEKAPAETPAKDTEEAAAKETPEETPAEDAGKAETEEQESENPSDDNGYPAVELSQTVGGVEIGLSAGEGVFPDGVTLSASRVKGSELKKVNKALKAERGDASSVDSSYTYDIKVLDAEGTEVQPADGKDVSLSFAAKKVADRNLSTRVYHIEDGKKELDATELKVSTDGDAATVKTDGFSYYTVEFTYGDKQYVLEGDGVVKLDDLLKEIGIRGEVKGTKVSDPELFDVILGTKKGVKYITRLDNGKAKKVPANDPEGKVRYVASYKAFDTEEWMDVLMKDGKKYHIIVTDDLIVNDGDRIPDIPGVFQGSGEKTFAENIPVATVWIDQSKLNSTRDCRDRAEFIKGALMTSGEHPGFREDTSGETNPTALNGYEGNHFIIFDTQLETLAGDEPDTLKEDESKEVHQSYNYFKGVVGTYKWEDAAYRVNSSGQLEALDVYVEYSNPLITIETDPDASSASSWGEEIGAKITNMDQGKANALCYVYYGTGR